MNPRNVLLPATVLATATVLLAMPSPATAQHHSVRLMTLDPGHFHAALVQKSMYPQVDPIVHVYAPAGPDLDLHLQRIETYNSRPENPTHWETELYTGPDYLDKMLADHPGNVVVLSGNNAKKADYILRCVQSGLNVLADKPMVITPRDFGLLQQSFAEAERRGLLLYDIMTERHEITTLLQRELSQFPGLFGKLESGTPSQPAVTKESVHHYFKLVSGKPLIRPPWFFDVTQQGEGIMDVTTHLVDLIQWECYPGKALEISDVQLLSARRWPTEITPAQFQRVTGLERYPDYLNPFLTKDGNLAVQCNGELTYKLRGTVCKIAVTWNFEAPEGAGDKHSSIMRGTRASLVIRQGAEQNYKPTLHIQPADPSQTERLLKELPKTIHKLQERYPGVDVKPAATGWEVVIPDRYKVGHEAHFTQVTEAYLSYLGAKRLPRWEVPNMLVKYYTLMRAYELSR